MSPDVPRNGRGNSDIYRNNTSSNIVWVSNNTPLFQHKIQDRGPKNVTFRNRKKQFNDLGDPRKNEVSVLITAFVSFIILSGLCFYLSAELQTTKKNDTQPAQIVIKARP